MDHKNRKIFIVIGIIIFIIPIILRAGFYQDPNNADEHIYYISFSPDGKKILFDRFKDKERLIDVYNLDTHELSAYQPPRNESWTMARYSHDGKHITFCIGERGPDGKELPGPVQIGIMDPDGKNARKITNSIAANLYPSFSFTDDKIIFGKCALVKEMLPKKVGRYDIYEVDIKTGVETRLTWFNMFTLLSPPYEFPDGKTIVFSEFGTQGKPPELMDKDNSFMVKKGDKHLPYPFVVPDSRNSLISDRNNTRRPLVSWDGKKILFQATALKQDRKYGEGNQFYEYSQDGKHRRLTYLPASTIYSADLSSDSRYLAVIYDPLSKGPVTKKIAICNLKDGTYKTIELPNKPSRIINQLTCKAGIND